MYNNFHSFRIPLWCSARHCNNQSKEWGKSVPNKGLQQIAPKNGIFVSEFFVII